MMGVVVHPLENHGVLRLYYHASNLLPNAYWISVELGEQGRVRAKRSRRAVNCLVASRGLSEAHVHSATTARRVAF